ncbi:hypothetical protein HO173_012942 [Letharia columbiana]|uniref:HIG1 domain-containing protein n=1 Tax=Letharia columbiana TaxID=112416 RepID=A0A8H6FE73_9LECA|nr:uncharacterized protein HO173_012942 [Letharia columbiana]KAF6224599.1 hypothetical protein HO173_012942 [Letharia columbiana]
MKILTKEEEQAHYNETLKGGAVGGTVGLALGVGGVFAAAARYPAFRQLTLPLRAFLCTSSATFGAIVTADRFSRSFEASRHPDEGYQDEAARMRAEQEAKKSSFERFMDLGKEYRYPIVGTSWVLGMGIALGVVGRSPYLSTQQKIVQARVYAQTITIAVLCATAVFEVGDRGKGEGRWETVKIVDPNDPTHKHLIDKKIHHERYEGEDQWRDMVEAEERKMKEREAAAHEQEKQHHKQHAKKKPEHEEEKNNEKKGGGDKK